MSYDRFQYLWPPRPENAIPPSMISFYERRGWIAQAKKNGTCNVIAVSPDRSLHCMTRHATEHKLWKPTEKNLAAFQTLPGDGWYVFVSELMHSKVSGGAKDTNFLNDVLVADGKSLTGVALAERLDLLRDLFHRHDCAETPTHYVIDDHTWLAKVNQENHVAFFDAMTHDEDEGIVLKDPKSRLMPCLRPNSNKGWSVKCRRATKTYSF